MSRFTSLTHARWETRRLLRARLGRLLPMRGAMPLLNQEREVHLGDEAMVRFLVGISLTHAADEPVARALYDHYASAVPGQPAFDDHIAAGWFRLFLARTYTGLDVSRGGRREAARLPALARYLERRYAEEINLPPRAAAEPDLTAAVDRISSEHGRATDISCPTPAWVAARLWEIRPWPTDPLASLRWWLDRWDILGAPAIVPIRDLAPAAARDLRSAMLDALVSTGAPHGWEEARIFFAQQSANATGQPFSVYRDHIPPPPPTLVGRARWLDENAVEAGGHEDGARHDIDAIVGLLLGEVEADLATPVPHPIIARLFDLGAVRADIMRAIVGTVRRRPALLADLLLHDMMSAVGVMLIATFDRHVEGWDKELQLRTEAQLKAIAIDDAIDLFMHHLAGDSLLADQAAGLMTVLYRWGALQPAIWQDSLIPEQLADALARQPAAEAVVDHLVAACAPIEHDGASFRAVLDLIAKAGLSAAVSGEALVEAYIEAVRAGEEEFALSSLSPAAAAVLLTLAGRCQIHAQDFIRPIAFEPELAKAHRDANHEGLVKVRRAILSTTRLLSRAIGVLGQAAPRDAIDGLIRTIKAGSFEDPAKGRTAAFAVPGWSPPRIYRGNRSLAEDLGAALSALPDAARDTLLNAILGINEPLVLAELLASAPRACRGAIIARLDGFAPPDAAELWSIDSHLQRIRALLNAGRADAAAAFIAFEQGLSDREIPGRAVAQFRHKLHLHLLRGEWAAITTATVPDQLPQLPREEAEDNLAHYQGIAALHNGGARTPIAVDCFERLSRRHPTAPSHAINLLAARSQSILGDNFFRLLGPTEQVAARRAIEDADRRLALIEGASEEERDALSVNVAILQLALGEPVAAAMRLDALAVRGISPDVAAYQAIAMARTGRAPAAMALLADVEAGLDGKCAILEAARAHIAFGTAFPARPVLALDLESGPLRAALYAISQLAAADQAHVLGSSSFTDHVVSHVRKACASLGNIVPMLQPGEDDVTAPLRELLTARFELEGWSLADQTKGGYTASGNPGERDLVVLQRETIITTLEAVIARGTVPRDDLAKHFRKLLGYARCQVYFHLTYAWLDSTAKLMATLEEIADKEVPDDYRYRERRPLAALGNQPDGFIASYEGEGGPIDVVFLVLDLEQASLRRIARQAPNTKTTKRRVRRPAAKP